MYCSRSKTIQLVPPNFILILYARFIKISFEQCETVLLTTHCVIRPNFISAVYFTSAEKKIKSENLTNKKFAMTYHTAEFLFVAKIQ